MLLDIVRPIALMLPATGMYGPPILDRSETPAIELIALLGREPTSN